MKKIILLSVWLSLFSYAGFMDSVGDIVESTLSDDKLKVKPEVTTVGTLSVTEGGSENEETSILDDMLESAKDTIGIKDTKPTKSSSIIGDTVTAVKEVTGLKKVKKDNSYFDGGIMGEMAELINLEKGESLGLPSVFGLNKKKEKKVFGSTVLGDTLLGDAKETGTRFYRGFKRTGESTEFMSGVMYKSSKIYNGMFEMFDDSPLNIFDDKEEREPSIFDVLDKGNDMLDIFE